MECYSQCDHIGRFLEFLGKKINHKSSSNVLWPFGQLWKPSLFKINWWGYFLANVWKILGLLFIPTSGHTGALERRWKAEERPTSDKRKCRSEKTRLKMKEYFHPKLDSFRDFKREQTYLLKPKFYSLLAIWRQISLVVIGRCLTGSAAGRTHRRAYTQMSAPNLSRASAHAFLL